MCEFPKERVSLVILQVAYWWRVAGSVMHMPTLSRLYHMKYNASGWYTNATTGRRVNWNPPTKSVKIVPKGRT